MESWVATHVSLGAQQTKTGWEKPIPATSGLTLRQESRQLDLFGASLRMSPHIYPWDSKAPSEKAYADWVMRLRAHSSQLNQSAHRTNGRDSSSLHTAGRWATPAARDYKGGYSNESLVRKDGKLRGELLPDQAVRWDITHLVLPTQDGTKFRSDYSQQRLNPDFTDWLMGWPDGWTSVRVNASALLETASYLEQQQLPGNSAGPNCHDQTH